MQHRLVHSLLAGLTLAVLPAAAQTNSVEKPARTGTALEQIRDEGLNHSEVMATLAHLTETIGPRLTGSPGLKRANDWTREQLEDWGLTNAHLEAWGPFGRGWSVKRFSAQIVEPRQISLIGYPAAWSPGLDYPVVADVVYLDSRTNNDLEQYKGKLKGAIVLAGGAPRETPPWFEPLSIRLSETNLLTLANAGESRGFGGGGLPIGFNRGPGMGPRPQRGPGAGAGPGGGTNGTRRPIPGGGRGRPGGRLLSFAASEGAAAVITPSSTGDGGSFVVAQATVPPREGQTFGSFTNPVRVWSTNAPAIPPQITLAVEDYNHLVRMAGEGQKLKMMLDLQVQFHGEDLMAYNTVAELPGTDKKDEIVMLGAHLDSWHAGTGATDNGVGAAVTMEAMRILKALNLKPRRTIRLALWSGEEQGLLGSRAYVASHFGYYTNSPVETPKVLPPKVLSPKDAADKTVADKAGGVEEPRTNSSSSRHLVKLAEYEKLSAYFNLDNGAGRVRGVYLQGNEGVRSLFRRWLEPFRDLDADTLTASSTGSTDHISFDSIGIPAFQFIQDPLDYSVRTHHTNQDLLDRVPPEDARQASVILAAFAWDAANADARLPRRTVD